MDDLFYIFIFMFVIGIISWCFSGDKKNIQKSESIGKELKEEILKIQRKKEKSEKQINKNIGINKKIKIFNTYKKKYIFWILLLLGLPFIFQLLTNDYEINNILIKIEGEKLISYLSFESRVMLDRIESLNYLRLTLTVVTKICFVFLTLWYGLKVKIKWYVSLLLSISTLLPLMPWVTIAWLLNKKEPEQKTEKIRFTFFESALVIVFLLLYYFALQTTYDITDNNYAYIGNTILGITIFVLLFRAALIAIIKLFKFIIKD